MAKAYVGVNTLLYTPLDYIETSGPQYIDTGIKMKDTLKVEGEFYDVGGYGFWYGARQNVSGAYPGITSNSVDNDTIRRFTFGGITENNFIKIASSLNTWHTVSHDKELYLDGSLVMTFDNSTYSLDSTLHIFALNDPPNLYTGTNHVRMKWFKVYDNGTLIKDFVAALDLNNVACVYDKVSGEFYYNKGTGTFTYGIAGEAEIKEVARRIRRGYVGVDTAQYTPVEYLQSSGTEYIDTGVYPNPDIHCIVDFQLPSIPSINCGIIGGWDSSQGMLFGVNSGNFKFAFGTSTWAGNTTSANTSRHVVYMNDENGDGRVDNTILASHSDVVSLINTSRTLYLFGSNGGTSKTGVKIFSCKIYDGSTLIRDYIPALNMENVPCMYDKVEGTFYYNKDTGTFTYGTAGEPVYKQVARKIKAGYVGINGVARKILFTGTKPVYAMSITNSAQAFNPQIAGTKNHVLVAGGSSASNVAPIKMVKAYDMSGVSQTCDDLPSIAWFGVGVSFNGYAIIAGGKTATSGSSRTSQCIAYSKGLVRTTLSTLAGAIYEPAGASNSTHFMIGGGTNYSQNQNTIRAYDTSFTRTSPSNMSIARRNGNFSNVGDYIVCCGGTENGNADFYDNSNVKTTTTSPYGKTAQYPLGLATKDYAIFFGGTTSNDSNKFADCKAFDSNKVLHSFSLPTAIQGAQGISNENYALVRYASYKMIYDNNLMLVSQESGKAYGSAVNRIAGNTEDFGIVLHNGWVDEFDIYDI